MGVCSLKKSQTVIQNIKIDNLNKTSSSITKADVSTIVKPSDLNLAERPSISHISSDKLHYCESTTRIKKLPNGVPLLEISKVFPQNQLTTVDVDLKKQA